VGELRPRLPEAHHSPLTQLNQSHVSQLTQADAVDAGSDGKLETTPLVFGGVLYGTSTWSQVYAIDLRTKKVKWQWEPGLVRGGFEAMVPRPCCGPVNRGVALYDGKVSVGVLDGRLVALSADNGKVVWSVQITPPNSDYTITGAPRVIKGNVVIDQGGGEYGVRGFLAAWNAQTGKLAWKWYTVPGDPSKGFEDESMAAASKTWAGQYWKVGGGDNLYLSSVVALNADTGKYVWHYQTTPGDNWDFNTAQPMILAESTIANQPRKVLMQAPKNRFFYVLDRTNGKLLSAQPFAYTSWATSSDMETSRPRETEQARYRYNPVRLSPSPVGAHHWPPMAFNPVTKLVYYPGQETSMVVAMEEGFEPTEGCRKGGGKRPRGGRAGFENGRYANRETALILPIIRAPRLASGAATASHNASESGSSKRRRGISRGGRCEGTALAFGCVGETSLHVVARQLRNIG
jgi:quinohemoprotein ethanol dehydrogenase